MVAGPPEGPAAAARGGRPGEGAAEPGSEVLVFLIADIRGYTEFTQRLGDEAAARLTADFAAVTREAVADHGGTVFELRGDEALCVFSSPRQSLRCAVSLQHRFVERTVADPQHPMAVGIGLDIGEAVNGPDGYRGGALNLAARLCSQARAGEILATSEVTISRAPSRACASSRSRAWPSRV
jgi:adenylate cyclase